MGVIRRRLVWLAAAWLAGELAGFAGAPMLVAFGSATVLVDDCGCPNVALGQMCPMHHQSRRSSDDGTCKMRSGCHPSDAALLSFASGISDLPPATDIVIAFDFAAAPGAIAPSALARAVSPESPPPRA